MYGLSVQVVADDQTVQCEHINSELWLFFAVNLLVQYELELNSIYKIVQCIPSCNELLVTHLTSFIQVTALTETRT